jgi:undecaprenyl-diphosphatase
MGKAGAVNYHLFELINGHAGTHDWLDDAMEWSATWIIAVMLLAAAVPGVAALRRRAIAPLGRVAAALLLAFVVGQVAAHLNHQLRPFQTHAVHQLVPHDPGVSLPSDHATAAFALAFAVAVFLSRPWGALLTVLAALLGFARIGVGVHYPGDILAGAVIAAAAVGVVLLGERYGRRLRRNVGGRAISVR